MPAGALPLAWLLALGFVLLSIIDGMLPTTPPVRFATKNVVTALRSRV